MSINKLVTLDYKILYELDGNARAAYSEIATKLKVSKQTVKNRMDKLIEDKIIKTFFTIVNEDNFGIKPLHIFVALNKVSTEKYQEIIDYLLKNKKVAQVTACVGIYDLYFGIVGRNPEEIDKELSKFYEQFSELIKDKKIVFFIDTHLYGRDYLLNKKRSIIPINRGFHKPSKEKVVLKEADFKVLGCLSAEPRIAATEIAQRTGLTVQTVIKKIKFLEESHIIMGYSFLLDPLKIVNHQILVEFAVLTKDLEKKVVTFCATNANALFVVKFLGEFNFSILVESLDHEEYREFVNEFKKEFSIYLKSFVPLLITDYPKLNFMPEL